MKTLLPRLAFAAFLLVACLLVATSGHAQPTSAAPSSVDQIMKASKAGDESVSMLNGTIGGNFFVSPFSAVGGTSTLLGAMLLVFNGAIFLVAVTWGTYNLLRAVIGTAQDGEVLGKQMSTVWMPIRMVTGIVGIVPVFGGFNLAQVVYVVVTALGIGIANLMFQAAITATSGFSTLLSPMMVSPNISNDYRKMVHGLFATEVCYLAKRSEEQAAVDGQALLMDVDRIGAQPMKPGSGASNLILVPNTLVKYGTPKNPTLCGHVALLAKPGQNTGSSKVLGFATGYENPAIDYAKIESVVRDGYAAAHQELVQLVRVEAQTWWQQRLAAQSQQGASPPQVPLDKLDGLARSYGASAQKAATEAAKAADQTAIQKSVQTKMEQGGWITLGSWHSAFTQANTAVVDAVSAISTEVAPPALGNDLKSSSLVDEAMDALAKSAQTAAQQSTAGRDKDDGVGVISQMICDSLSISNAVGSCSLGQAAVRAAIGGAAAGTGGGQLIDPIVMFKNMGDWMMTAGGVGLLSSAGLSVFGEGAAAVASKVAGFVPGASVIASSAERAGAVVGKLAGFLMMIAGTMIFIGGVMSVYIPLVPFLTWMGGLIQYFVIFFEGMAAMTLAALAHMDSQGEGMGQRAEPGYIFMLNMLARPGLMVLGFIAASGACIALGSIQAKMFLPAIANSQGNSVTGLFSFIFLIVIFLILNWTLIQGLFNMIFLLPDNVIGIIGRSGGAELGKEVEGKAYNLMVGFARNVSNSSVGAVARNINKLKSKSGNGSPGDKPQNPLRGASRGGGV